MFNFRKWFFVLCAVAISPTIFTSTAAAQEVKSSLSATDSGRIIFMSANRHATFKQMYQKKLVFNEAIYGDLSFPADMKPGQKVPVMVIMHASGGVNNDIYGWAHYFNDMGIASFVIDSFSPRGISRTAEDQTLLSFPASAADALTAMQLLATDPAIDTQKIGIIGFSRGGGAALHSSFERIRRSVIKDDTKFAVHLLFYPACSQYARTTGAPLRIFLGNDDAYNTVETCENNVAALKSVGADVDITVYKGAKHGFDRTGPQNIWANSATTDHDCSPGTVNLDTGQAVMIDGRHLSAAEFFEYRRACTKRGLYTGSDPKAREASHLAVKALLQKQFELE